MTQLTFGMALIVRSLVVFRPRPARKSKITRATRLYGRSFDDGSYER